MPYRYTEFQAGKYYHLFYRGADKQKIFFEDENYFYFLRLVRKSGEGVL